MENPTAEVVNKKYRKHDRIRAVLGSDRSRNFGKYKRQMENIFMVYFMESNIIRM